uniref:Uncharacterized protein n=1 Tax=Cucumis melo TaxID=3656 RepID=A0A9I9DK32_CUCME
MPSHIARTTTEKSEATTELKLKADIQALKTKNHKITRLIKQLARRNDNLYRSMLRYTHATIISHIPIPSIRLQLEHSLFVIDSEERTAGEPSQPRQP